LGQRVLSSGNEFVRELGNSDNVRYRWISRQRQVQGTLVTLRDDREELVALKREVCCCSRSGGGRVLAFVSRSPFEYIEPYYDQKRHYSTLGYYFPVACEERATAT